MKVFFIVLFVILTSATVLIAIQAKQLLKLKLSIPQQTDAMQSSQIAKTASLYFSPGSLSYSSLQVPTQTDLMINAGNTAIESVQIELKYNPSVVSNVRVTLPDQSFFGTRQDYTVLFSDVNAAQGRISLALRANSPHNPTGTGVLAHISFFPKYAASSIISFTPATFVTTFTSRESILSTATNLIFSYQQKAATSSSSAITTRPQQ